MTMSASPAAKEFSPVRHGVRNLLSLPFQLVWPRIQSESSGEIIDALIRSCTHVHRRARGGRRARHPPKAAPAAAEHAQAAGGEDPGKKVSNDELECGEPPCKKRRKEEKRTGSVNGVEGDATGVFNSEKHAQIAVGTNSVTRCLERGALRAAVVCLSSSARPLLVHRHLMMLSASRGVPCAALPGLGSSLAPLLGIKNVLVIGFKKLAEGQKKDYFSDVVEVICRLAPPIDIPWLKLSPVATVPEQVPKSSGQENQTTPTHAAVDRSTAGGSEGECSPSRRSQANRKDDGALREKTELATPLTGEGTADTGKSVAETDVGDSPTASSSLDLLLTTPEHDERADVGISICSTSTHTTGDAGQMTSIHGNPRLALHPKDESDSVMNNSVTTTRQQPDESNAQRDKNEDHKQERKGNPHKDGAEGSSVSRGGPQESSSAAMLKKSRPLLGKRQRNSAAVCAKAKPVSMSGPGAHLPLKVKKMHIRPKKKKKKSKKQPKES